MPPAPVPTSYSTYGLTYTVGPQSSDSVTVTIPFTPPGGVTGTPIVFFQPIGNYMVDGQQVNDSYTVRLISVASNSLTALVDRDPPIGSPTPPTPGWSMNLQVNVLICYPNQSK